MTIDPKEPKPPEPDKEHQVIPFPKKYNPPPKNSATRRKTKAESLAPSKYHDEIFEYKDGSYVILVQPKKEKFSVERMIFMAKRLEMSLFDALPCYDDDEEFMLELDPENLT